MLSMTEEVSQAVTEVLWNTEVGVGVMMPALVSSQWVSHTSFYDLTALTGSGVLHTSHLGTEASKVSHKRFTTTVKSRAGYVSLVSYSIYLVLSI